MKMKTVAAAAALMVAPAVTFAATPTLSEVLAASGITVSGAVDAGWDYTDADTGPVLRAFEGANGPNEFSLHQVNVSVGKLSNEGVGFLANVVAGDDAAVIGGSDTDFNLVQGYVQYAVGGATIQVGRMLTLAGAEVINPAGNVNATRGLLFTLLQPATHTGVRASYKVSDVLSLTLGLNNSSSTTAGGLVGLGGSGKQETNTDKTLEAQIALTPAKNVSTYLTFYRGEEDATTASGGGVQMGNLVDLVVNVGISDAVTVGLNADYLEGQTAPGSGANAAFGEKVDATGVAGYVNAKIGKARVAFRTEYVDHEAVGTDGRNTVRSNTLTGGYTVATGLELIGEVRSDVLDNGGAFGTANFPITNATVAGGTNNDQTTVTVKAIYSF